MKTLIAGNWKMNGTRAFTHDLCNALTNHVKTPNADVEMLICPSAILIRDARDSIKDSPIKLGAQDCSNAESGAYTGEVSAGMLKDMGCDYVILGHSERRSYHSEANALICEKSTQAKDKGLIPIICVGETLKKRIAGKEFDVIKEQLIHSVPKSIDDFVIAYEPVWAIGTGKVAEISDIHAMHEFIYTILSEEHGRAVADKTRILYGGSMKPSNAKDILAVPRVHGGLIGGAALKAETFNGVYDIACGV